MAKAEMLPTIDLCGRPVTRLIIGGNPFSGHSHASAELDWEMARYFTQEQVLQTLAECERHGINAAQMRGDAFIMRAYLEHRERGGRLQWIAQTASEIANLKSNVRAIVRFGAMAVYHHGTCTDNLWHAGRIDEAAEALKLFHDAGLPAGLGTHLPEVVEYAEARGWEADFYMCCFYNLARREKTLPALGQNSRPEKELYPDDDPDRMTRVMRATAKPCLGFKILAAGRRCATPDDLRAAFQYALTNIKPTDAVVVGMFPKYRNQVAENVRLVREILGA
jgi:hypothetical protein